MVIIRSPDSATGQPGCQEYRTWERCSIRDTVAVNRFGCRCLRGAAAAGVLADADGAGWAELAGGGGNSLGALPPQPAPASTSVAASTAGATAARILPTPAEPTRNPAARGRHRRRPGNRVRPR